MPRRQLQSRIALHPVNQQTIVFEEAQLVGKHQRHVKQGSLGSQRNVDFLRGWMPQTRPRLDSALIAAQAEN
jgi:hypothetical protein